MSTTRRSALLGLVGLAFLSTDSMAKALRQANADGSYCYRATKNYRRYRSKSTCMPGPIPSEQIEALARDFGGESDRLTIYFVRKHPGDTGYVIRVSTPDSVPVDTVPESFARLRLPPGQHALRATWPEGSASLAISGSAGEVLVVEIVGQIRVLGSAFHLEPGTVGDARERARDLRFVADVG